MPTLSQGSAPNTVSAPILSEDRIVTLTVNVGTLSAVGAAAASNQTVTVSGLLTTDTVLSVNKPTYQTGLVCTGGWVSAANTLAIQFINPTAAGITPTASESYLVTVFRPAYINSKTAFEG